MQAPFDTALRISWLTLIAYWIWSGRNVKSTVRTETFLYRFAWYWLPLIAALLLLGPGKWFGRTFLREQFVPHSVEILSFGLVLCIAGIALACWSRYLLGRNWSSVVQLKEGHELIDTGPYGYIRHPIYTGLLVAVFGNAIMVGDWRGLVAVLIVFASFWRKLRLEERWLGEYFGARYAAYKDRTKALLPGIL